MKVRNKEDNREYEATKKEDGSYSVNGKDYSKEDMTKLFVPIKEKKAPEPIETPIGFAPPRVEFVGDDLSGIFGAIAIVSGDMTNLNKEKEAFNYRYMTLGQIIDMTREPLAKNGVAVMNFPSTYFLGGQLIARVEVIVSHKSGSRIASVFDVPVNHNPKKILVQEVAAIHSYCVRYHRVNLLGIAGEDDTDGK